MTLDILCKVVDNYGDIGVVYRLARAVSELEPELRLRLVVDGLESFHLLEPAVDPKAEVQHIRGWTLLSWAGPSGASRAAFEAAYSGDPARVVIECFACGRPGWLEAMLFGADDGIPRTIVNLEYLSAEPYAVEFHRMPSLTRSPAVRKHFFMPGFEAGTGGLLLDRAFVGAMARHAGRPGSAGRKAARRGLADRLGLGATDEDAFWVTVFGYERDYSGVVGDIAALCGRRPVLACVASGKSRPCFRAAWERAGRPFPAAWLPFLPQEDWDELLAASDFSIVRGEDSMSRAALSGKPFLWQAYPQDVAHQLVKVRALLDRMRPCFEPSSFAAVEAAFIAFNDRMSDGADVRGVERIGLLLVDSGPVADGFAAFSVGLAANGNLAAGLMTFLREIV